MQDQIFASDKPKVPLFFLAFRAFFLFGALFSSSAILIWVLTLNGIADLPLYGGSMFWHIHEMIFGFVAAIIVGFLLTAVQTWTSVKSVNGLSLSTLFSLWLLVRFCFVVIPEPANVWLAALDISFLLIAALFLSIPLIKARQTRNLFFVPVLILLSASNAMMHIGLFNHDHDLVIQGTRSALMLITLLMVVIGGRVIPMFTANGTKTKRVVNIPWLDRSALSAVWLLMLIHLCALNTWLPTTILAGLFILAGLLHVVRLLRWRSWVTFTVPLLWPLHLAYGFIALALILLGMDLLLSGQTSSISWHVLTVGGIGTLILAMISRVSLGHTGRALKAPKWMLPAFILITLSTILRTALAALFPEQLIWSLSLSGIAWTLAFVIFAVGYLPALTQPRADA